MRNTYQSFYIVLLVLLSSQVFGQGISMSPTRAFFTGNPGETVTQTITLSNTSDKDYVFNINTKDWKREEDGNKVYSASGTLEHSNSNWISTLESNITLPAKSSTEILVAMEIPENASPSELTNSMLFFTQIGKQEDQAQQQMGIGIIALFEFGLHVYYTPPKNDKKSLEITAIDEIVAKEPSTHSVAVRILNDGNVVNDAIVELELTNTASGEDSKLSPINISMMPNTYQTITFTLPENLKGSYMGVTIVKMAGTNDLRVGEKTFEF